MEDATETKPADELLTAADASKFLDLTPEGVKYLESVGQLRAAQRTRGGIRLFRLADVMRLAAQRKASGRLERRKRSA